MNKLMVVCFSAVSLCGFVASANAATLNSTAPAAVVSGTIVGAQANVPYVVAQPRIKFRATHTPGMADTQYFFTVAPAPNANGSPIPTGG